MSTDIAGHEDKTGAHTDSDNQAAPPFKALFAFTKKGHIPLLLCASTCSLASSAVTPVQALLTGKIFDGFVKFAIGSITADELISQQRTWILYTVAVASASWISHAVEFALWIRFGELQTESARQQLYAGLAAMDIAWYDLCEGGIESYLPRLHSQVRDLQLATSQPLGSILASISTSLISLGQAFYNSWDLTLVTLAATPVIIAVLVIFGSKMQKAIQGQDAARATMQAQALEVLSNVDTVKCFNAQAIESKRYVKGIAGVATWYMKIAGNSTWQMCILTFLIQSMFVQAFYYGGVLVRNGSRQPSQIITTFFSAIAAFLALQSIVPQLVIIEKGKHASIYLKRMMPAVSRNAQVSGIKPMHCLGSFELRNVVFRYPARPAQLALDSISLMVPASSLVFIVGPSGSGKSTIGQILNGFYAVEQGSLFLDGKQLSDLDVQWLRTKVMLVEQSSTLFQGSIKDNLMLGASGASSDAIDVALDFALLRNTILDLPRGLDTALGYSSQSLSGGQRQRLALARARIIDPPVLILDESTSALDQPTRELLLAAIRFWRKERTTIIITHDLPQIEARDRVIVLAAGRVVQDGLRAELEKESDSLFAMLASRGSESVERLETEGPAETAQRARRKTQRRPGLAQTASLYLDHARLSELPLPAVRFSRALSMTSSSFGMFKTYQNAVGAQGAPSVGSEDSAKMSVGHRVPRRAQDDSAQLTKSKEDDDEMITIDSQTYTLKAMLKLLWQQSNMTCRISLGIGFAAGTAHAACSPAFSYVLSKLLALYAQPGDTTSQSIHYALAIVGVAVVDALSTYLYRYLIELASQRWVDTLRREAFQRLLAQSQDFLDNGMDTASSLVETLDQQGEEMRNMFGRFMVMLWIAACILLISFIWALTAEWRLTLLCMTAGPYVFLVAKGFTRISQYWERRSIDAGLAVNLVFDEAFGKVRTVRSLAIQSHFDQKYKTATDHALRIGLLRGCWSGFFYGMSSSAEQFAIALVFYLGTKLAHDGTSIFSILQVFSILILSISNITGILDFVPQMSLATEMARRVLRLANLSEPTHNQPSFAGINTVGPIELKSLSFSYPARPAVSVLKSVSLTVRPGRTTAIVGGSGSGKSSIAKLLLKLYEVEQPASGRLLVSGRDIQAIRTSSMRAITAVVAQDAPLFHASIADNITYGLPERSQLASHENVLIAAKRAGIHDFVTSLPDGFDTVVGAKGIGLSGGQSQRIAIARALVRRPSLLILDEATSALDTQSALVIRQTIRQLIETEHDMTIILITHDKDMMACADRVIVLDAGRVVESGSFGRLLEQRGKLWEMLKS